MVKLSLLSYTLEKKEFKREKSLRALTENDKVIFMYYQRCVAATFVFIYLCSIRDDT